MGFSTVLSFVGHSRSHLSPWTCFFSDFTAEPLFCCRSLYENFCPQNEGEGRKEY